MLLPWHTTTYTGIYISKNILLPNFSVHALLILQNFFPNSFIFEIEFILFFIYIIIILPKLLHHKVMKYLNKRLKLQ